jgi:hypothetical protein
MAIFGSTDDRRQTTDDRQQTTDKPIALPLLRMRTWGNELAKKQLHLIS